MGKELLVEAYIYKPEIKSPPGLVIKVLSGEEKKIHSVKLFKADDSPITADTVLKYNQTIKVKVYTQNMPEEFLKLTLYEDDAKGGGHNAINEQNKVAEITKRTNKNGFLWHEFKLKADFSKIANAIMDGSSDKHHEYYVLVESAENGSKSSRNANVENPDYIKTQTVSASSNKIYYGTPIKEVVVKGRLKKQVGIDPMPKTGKSMSKVAQQEKEQTKEEEKKEEVDNSDKAIYEIYLRDKSISKMHTNNSSDIFEYRIKNDKKSTPIATYMLKKDMKGKLGLLTFPEKGINWERYGSRDKGGDNWINERVAAYFFGFLYNVKEKFPNEKIYFDDISGYDGRNIGHKTHRKGEDIDVRYPGTNATVRFYYQSSYYNSKEKDDSELVKILEAILDIAVQWKFSKNYVYKNGIKNSIYASNHDHHYHIGCRNYNDEQILNYEKILFIYHL